uniref:Uncharacterized protein n=1 Tax=Helianthus annuus TaxID=4232 RepID=A0A251U8R6_HELAN
MVFGHSFKLCKNRPKMAEEIAAPVNKDDSGKAKNNLMGADKEFTAKASKIKKSNQLKKGKGSMTTGTKVGNTEAEQPNEKTTSEKKHQVARRLTWLPKKMTNSQRIRSIRTPLRAL